MEVMGHLKETNIQQVVEWWHIFVTAHTLPLVVSQGSLENVKEFLMISVPPIPWCSPIRSWVGSVNLGHAVG